MFEGLITTLNLFYSLQEPYACVRFAGDNDTGLMFTLIHQTLTLHQDFTSLDDVKATVDIYDFLGSEASPKFDVEDKDVLIILAKRHDTVVASQVFEVDFGATSAGYLLLPRGGFNLLCDQNEMEAIECEREATQPLEASPSLLPWYAGCDVEPIREDLPF